MWKDHVVVFQANVAISKNILVAEKSKSKALLIGRHLEISSLLLMSVVILI